MFRKMLLSFHSHQKCHWR